MCLVRKLDGEQHWPNKQKMLYIRKQDNLNDILSVPWYITTNNYLIHLMAFSLPVPGIVQESHDLETLAQEP